jgi:hypothetical protein
VELNVFVFEFISQEISLKRFPEIYDFLFISGKVKSKRFGISDFYVLKMRY